MIALARGNASRHSYTNVSFVESDITSTPLEDGIADCIISNCVINLVPEKRKHLVFKDMFRLLKTGGRIAISDLLALKELPNAIRSNIAAYVGCIAGAAQASQYEQWLHEAGFTGESPPVEAKRSSHPIKTSCLSIRGKMPTNTKTRNAASRNLRAVEALARVRTSRLALLILWRIMI
jgi:SAM-dependent methyltransferase